MNELLQFFSAMWPLPINLQGLYLGGLFNGIVLFGGLYVWKKVILKKYKETHSQQLLNSVPNIFTSLGILFTFVSICYSLSGVSSVEVVEGSQRIGKTVGELQNRTDIDLPTIVKNLIPAFSTSIWGIILAMYSNYKSRMLFADEEAEYDKEHATPEKNLEMLVSQMQEMKTSFSGKLNVLDKMYKHMKEQDETTKQYNDQLNSNIKEQSSILEKFVNDFVARMDDIFTRMHDAVEQQIMTFGQAQFSRTNDIMQKLTEEMSSMSKTLVEKQSESVNQMMTDTNTQITSITERLTALTNNIADQNSSALEALSVKQNEKLDAIISSYNHLSQDSLSSFKEMGEEMKKLGTTLAEQNNSALSELNQQQTEKLNAIIAGYTDLNKSSLESYQQMAENMKQMNNSTAEEIRTSLRTSVSDITSSISMQCNTLGDAITKNVEKLEHSYSFIDKYVAQLKADYEQSTLAYTDAVQNAHDLNASFEDTIKQVDNSLKSVVSTNEMIDKIMKMMNERQTNIESLIQKIKEVGSTIETLQKLESTLNKVVNR